MKHLLLLLTLLPVKFAFSEISILREDAQYTVVNLKEYRFRKVITLLKTGDSIDYFAFSLSESEHLDKLVVQVLKKGKLKAVNVSDLISESTIDNSSFFSGHKTYYFPINEFGEFTIEISATCQETIFISAIFKNGEYNAADAKTMISLPENLVISLSNSVEPVNKIEFNKTSFSDSITTIYGLIHPKGENPLNYFSNWFESKLESLSILRPEDIPKEISDKSSLPRDQLAEVIFNYVQKTIKYVAIENGINAIVPRDCHFVQQKGRGDCKDMANLLYAYYKFYGFDTKLVISKTNSKPEKFDFPSIGMANHMICRLKIDGQIFYLDATERNCKFRDLSIQIFNSQAFIIGEKPYFVDIGSKPFYESRTELKLNFKEDIVDSWIGKLEIRTIGKSNIGLMEFIEDKNFKNHFERIANLLVDFDWITEEIQVTDSASYLSFLAKIPKSNTVRLKEIVYFDLSDKIKVSNLSLLFWGDTIPLFEGSMNFLFEFTHPIENHLDEIELKTFKRNIDGQRDEKIRFEFVTMTEDEKLVNWQRFKNEIDILFKKSIKLKYETD